MALRAMGDAGCLEDLERRVLQLRPDSTRVWGRMTPHQMVCHLADAYRVLMGLKEAQAVGSRVSCRLIRGVALYLPLPWPRGVKTGYACDPEGGMTKPAVFAADVNELLVLMKRFVHGTPAFAEAPHPAMGPLTRWQRMRWGYLHADHHLRQFGL